MINLSDQFVGGRFAVGKIRYKLLDEIWVYGAKDSQKGKEIFLLILLADHEREKLDSFIDYLGKYDIGTLESSYLSHRGETYFYVAVDLADKTRLEEVFQNWISGKPAPAPQPRPGLVPTPLEKEPILVSEYDQKPLEKQTQGYERLKFFSIGVASALGVLGLIALFASPYIAPLLSPTSTPTPTLTLPATLTVTAIVSPSLTLTPTGTSALTPTPTPTITLTPVVTGTETPTLHIFVLKAGSPAQNFQTGESLTIPANSSIIIVDANHTACEVLADWNGTQVLISAGLIFPERACK